jgi:hypothetical protein
MSHWFDVPEQAEKFLLYWDTRRQDDFDHVFDFWAASKDFNGEDKALIRRELTRITNLSKPESMAFETWPGR